MLFDVVEKETSDDFVSLHERILYLLANAYLSYRSLPQILDAPQRRAVSRVSPALLAAQHAPDPVPLPPLLQFHPQHIRHSPPLPSFTSPGKGHRVLPACCRGGAAKRRVHRPRGVGAALCCHLAESCMQTKVGSRFLFHRSVEQAWERHPEWKSSLRVELLCGYLSNPLCIDQSVDLFEECLAGTIPIRLSARTHRRTLPDCSGCARPRILPFSSRRSSSRACSSSARTSTPTTTTRPARWSSFPSYLL